MNICIMWSENENGVIAQNVASTPRTKKIVHTCLCGCGRPYRRRVFFHLFFVLFILAVFVSLFSFVFFLNEYFLSNGVYLCAVILSSCHVLLGMHTLLLLLFQFLFFSSDFVLLYVCKLFYCNISLGVLVGHYTVFQFQLSFNVMLRIMVCSRLSITKFALSLSFSIAGRPLAPTISVLFSGNFAIFAHFFLLLSFFFLFLTFQLQWLLCCCFSLLFCYFFCNIECD